MDIEFAAIDIVFSILILAAAVRGAIRGFVTEIGSVAAIFLGISGAILFFKSLALVIEEYFGASIWNQVIGFLIIFLVVYIAVKLLESLLRAIFERLNLERLDRTMGFFLGIAEGILLVGVILFILYLQPIFEVDELLADSFFAKILLAVVPTPEKLIDTQNLIINV